MSISSLVLILIFSQVANAGFVSLDLGINQGKLGSATDDQSQRTQTSLGLFAHLGRNDARSGALIGWMMYNVNHNASDSNGVEKSITSQDMGPSFRWSFENTVIYSITAFYGIICKGKLKENAIDSEVRGESYLLRFGMDSRLGEHLMVGFALNSYNASYSTQLISNVQSDVSFKNNWIYPTIGLAYNF